ncbi:hypothetical protein AGMMS49992_22780 [Clostridia bacterium]|nr:hypothetical protein AGMMS49992_22780 [Clostridia bacterium]
MGKILSDAIPHLGGKPLYFDGGFGTQLQLRGLPQGMPPGLWNIHNPEAVKDVHLAYQTAGCDVVTSNTFTSHHWFVGDDAEAATAAGVRIAREAARESGHGCVALDVGPSGRLLEPFGDLPFEEAVAGYTRMIAAGVAEGPDFILLETFTDAYEAKAAVLAAQSCSDLPVMVSFSFNNDGRLLTGLDAPGVAAMFEGLGVAAVGANCGLGPDGMAGIIRELAQSTRLPIFANPNAGLPEMVGGQAVFRLSPGDYAPLAAALFDEGAWMVGGCCGTTPEHIQALRAASEGKRLQPRPADVPAMITSGSRSFILSNITNISDALDAKANPRFRALLGGDPDEAADAAADIAFDALDDGAQALQLNLDSAVGAAFYSTLIPRLQSMVHIPLIFADADPDALQAALRVYNGHTIIKKEGHAS